MFKPVSTCISCKEYLCQVIITFPVSVLNCFKIICRCFKSTFFLFFIGQDPINKCPIWLGISTPSLFAITVCHNSLLNSSIICLNCSSLRYLAAKTSCFMCFSMSTTIVLLAVFLNLGAGEVKTAPRRGFGSAEAKLVENSSKIGQNSLALVYTMVYTTYMRLSERALTQSRRQRP